MTKDDGAQLSQVAFWDARYAKTDGAHPTHEWFRTFDDLAGFFEQRLFTVPGRRPIDEPRVLHLGSGDSEIPTALAARGYGRQVCVDFSPTVVELMRTRWATTYPSIAWRQLDVRDMQTGLDGAPGLGPASIDVAFDKGTLDAMIHGSPWSPPSDVWENTGRYLREVHRVLVDDGIFLWVTYRPTFLVRPLLEAGGLWTLELQVLSGPGGGFDYYGWILTKAVAATTTLTTMTTTTS